MSIVCHQHDRVGQWVMDRCDNEWFPGKGVTIGYEDSTGTLVAGCVFEQYNGTHMFLHAACEHGAYLSPDFLSACFHFAFVVNGCKRISCVVDSSNKLCRRFVRRIGWKEDVKLVGAGFAGGDLIVFKMTPRICRWLTEGDRNGC